MPPRPSPRHVPSRGARLHALGRVLAVLLTVGSVAATGVAVASASARTPAVAGTHARVAPEPAAPPGVVRRAARQPARQQVTVKAPTAARTGSKVTLSGTVSPVRSGLKVSVQRRYGGRWHAVTTTRLSAKGTWAATTRTPAGRGWLRYRVLAAKNGNLPARTVEPARIDNYTRHTYVVRKRGAVTVSMKEFARQAAQTYAHERGWRAAHHRFARVSSGGSFTLVLAEARYLPAYSPVCSVKYSCRAGRYVVINQNRWRRGSTPFTGPLRDYRHMVVNHETGHWLGRHHAFCSHDDALAPVMQQQSKGLQGCRPNAWPLADELEAVA
jgi:Protein of unknown function (DUF3152)